MLKLQETQSHHGLLLGQGWRSGRKRTKNEAVKGKLEGQGEESRVGNGCQGQPITVSPTSSVYHSCQSSHV